MKASEKTIQDLLHGASRFVIPVFQRYYVWTRENWAQLWDNLDELCEQDKLTQRHFLGSVVCLSDLVQPGMTPTFQVIDGQQRLMTISLLLCAIRDAASRRGWPEFAEEVQEGYLIHKFKKGAERHRLAPRLRDRAVYFETIDQKEPAAPACLLLDACKYHWSRLEPYLGSEADLRRLFEALVSRLDIVSITLSGENPFKIFRSLNSTGVDLEEADLIRNHVFMSLDVAAQDEFDEKKWRPLEQRFGLEADSPNRKKQGAALTAFFRDVLMMDGAYVRENETFERFEKAHPFATLRPDTVADDLAGMAALYQHLHGEHRHKDRDTELALEMLRELDVTSAHPLALKLLQLHQQGRVPAAALAATLRAISGFIVRRIICNKSSRTYGRWFCALCRGLEPGRLDGVTHFLQNKGWPDDDEFTEHFVRFDLYNSRYAKILLSRIERTLQNPAEPVLLDRCEVEHVMPQTIDPEDAAGRSWIETLGDGWETHHRTWAHTPGNLTLVGENYNRSMSNRSFVAKKGVLVNSKVSLNRHLLEQDRWDIDTIRERGLALAEQAAEVWTGPPEDPTASQSASSRARQAIEDFVRKVGARPEKNGRGSLRYHRMPDGKVTHVKFSRLQAIRNQFWFGINSRLPEDMVQQGCDEVCLLLEGKGYLRLPLRDLHRSIQDGALSRYASGEIKHYHLYVHPETFVLSSSPRSPLVSGAGYFQAYPADSTRSG